MQKKQDNQFKLEALEPRLLLSGDASAVAADFAVGLDYIPVLVEQLQTSDDHLNQPLPLIGQNLTDILNPAAQLEDLFAGLTQAELDSPEDLANALDAESGVDADLVERMDDGFTLDLRVSGVFEGVVPLAVAPENASTLEQPYGEGLVLYGAVRLSGDWALNLRIIDDSSNEDAPFSIDSTLSSLRVNVAASAPILLSGQYNGVGVTGLTDLQFQARFETDFRDADGHDQIALIRLSDGALNLLSTTSLEGHAAIALQLVKTLNAAHGPPRVPLFWQEVGARSISSVRSAVVLGTDLSADERSGVAGILLPIQIGTTGVPEDVASDNWADPFEMADRLRAATVRMNEEINDFAVSLDDLADLSLGDSGGRFDFDSRVELVFNGLDPPTSKVENQTPDPTHSSLYRSLLSNDVFAPVRLALSVDVNTATPFEFTVVSASPSDLTLRLNGEDLEIIDNLTGALLAGRPLGETSEIIIHGVDNLDDTLTVDFNGGLIEVPITFHGAAAGFDSLFIEGGFFTRSNYVATGPDSGSITLDTTVIYYTGLEPITDNTATTDRVFTDNTSGDQQIRIIDDAAAGFITIDSNGTGGFESLTFPNPTSSLTINAGDGNDTITIEVLDNGFNVPIIVNGQAGNDSLVIVDGAPGDITFDGGDSSFRLRICCMVR